MGVPVQRRELKKKKVFISFFIWKVAVCSNQVIILISSAINHMVSSISFYSENYLRDFFYIKYWEKNKKKRREITINPDQWPITAFFRKRQKGEKKRRGENGYGRLTHHEPLLHVKSQLKPGEASLVVTVTCNTVTSSPLTLPFSLLPSANCQSGIHAVMAVLPLPPPPRHQ